MKKINQLVTNFDDLDSDLFIVNQEDANNRLDKFLKEKKENISRNYLQDLIKEGYVFVNDKQTTKPSLILEENDKILIYYKMVEDLNILPENIPLNIVYEDDDVIVINKESGMVVHPSPGHVNNTLVNALLYHCKNLSTINGIKRPGIVHRIDKDTSGLLVVAKNDNAHNFLANQLKDHSMARTYYCIVKGIPESKKGMIKTLIGRDKKDRLKQAVVNENGKEAITEFELIKTIGSNYSLIKCHLQTGRTHQIRVHMNFIKHPIVNDPLYGENNKIKMDTYLLLHAACLDFVHPTSKEKMHFEIDLPERFYKVMDFLKDK